MITHLYLVTIFTMILDFFKMNSLPKKLPATNFWKHTIFYAPFTRPSPWKHIYSYPACIKYFVQTRIQSILANNHEHRTISFANTISKWIWISSSQRSSKSTLHKALTVINQTSVKTYRHLIAVDLTQNNLIVQ